MNPKITKLRTERGKNETKISELQARNKEIDGQILEHENTDIIGLVRASGMTPEQLSQLIASLNKQPMPMSSGNQYDETEDSLDEN